MIQELRSQLKAKDHIVFDFDLTIAKMDIDWSDWFVGAAKIYSSFELDYKDEKGRNPHEFHNQMVEKHGDELMKQMDRFQAQYEEENTRGFILYEELAELLRNLTDKDLYIYSSNSRKTVEKGLEEFEILDLFKQIISREDVRLLKPSPEGFGLIGNLEEDEDVFLMVGDSSSDELAADAAGIDFLKCEYFGTYKY